MNFIKLVCLCFASLALTASSALGQGQKLKAEKQLEAYLQSLKLLHEEHPNQRVMEDLKFFLFGMGDRQKLIYKQGVLKDAKTGAVIKKWDVQKEIIVPSEYLVYLETVDNKKVRIEENEKGVYVNEGGKRMPVTLSKLNLPDFKGYKYAPILRTLHHEVLINVDEGLPVPNFFVYKKPWFRDAAIMGMVLEQTDNLHVIKDWIMQIRDPFDRNNHGISEADNPGQVLFLISLVSDKNHPAVRIALDSVEQFRKEDYIEGKTDYGPHPVFQTKWIKYGLKSLGLRDNYSIPKVYDSYSSLFWWDYKEQHVEGRRFEEGLNFDYPYLVWAEDNFFGETNGMISSQNYPLSWESKASDAYYPGLELLDKKLIPQKLSPPHTWHASEMFLLLSKFNTESE
jgi:hypothetical protein